MTKPFHLVIAAVLAACSGDAPDDLADDDTGTPPLPPTTGDAVAIARIRAGADIHLVLVTRDDGGAIDGVDLGAFATPILDRIAVRGIAGILADAQTAPPIHVSYAMLLPPVEQDGSAVEAVDNYRGGTGRPFLYPNVARLEGPSGTMESAELLDYSAHLCAVLGAEVASAELVTTAPIGFVLCHHAIDRSIQIAEGDLDDPEDAEALPDAGYGSGYYRMGPYLYYPRDPAAYLARARLELAVNNQPRQHAALTELVWNLSQLAAATLAIGDAELWERGNADLSLIPGTTLPAGLVFLTGTPAGIAYDPPDDDDDEDDLIDEQRASGRYLEVGDRVDVTATNLGSIHITVE